MRKTIAGGMILAGLMTLSGVAQAQGQGYRLLVERGVDAIAVRHVLADRMGEPVEINWISKQIAADTAAMSQVRASSGGRQTIVVGCPELIHAVGGSALQNGRIATDLSRVLPGDSLAVARID